MFSSPYSTTIGSKFNLAPVTFSLEKADIQNQLRVISADKPWLLAVVNDPGIPLFVHPVTLHDQNRGSRVVVDLRQYGRYINDLKDRIVIAPYGGAAVTVNRAILQYYWNDDTANSILGLSNLPVSIYGKWLSEQIIRGLSVEEAFHQRVRVIITYFFLALFEKDGTIDRRDAMHLSNKVSGATGITQSLVLEYIPDVIPSTIPELVDLLSNGDYGMRLENLNPGIFYQITTKGFFGVTRPDEVLAVGIEYPPTFIAIAYAVVNDRSYNKTPLQLAAKPYDRKNAFKGFNMAFDQFVGISED